LSAVEAGVKCPVKLEYRNFSRLGSKFPWPTQVPDHLVRKHKALHILEFLLFIVGVALVLRSGYVWFTSNDAPDIFIAACIVAGGLSVASSLLLALESWHYLRTTSITLIALIVLAIFAPIPLPVTLVILVPLGVVLVCLYSFTPFRTYYLWTTTLS
jgi:hypothetical protein